MIPIGLPSIEFMLAVMALLLTTAVWIGWSGWMFFRDRGFKRLRGIRLVAYLIVTAVSLFTVYKIVELNILFDAFERDHTQNYQPTLAVAQQIEGIEMPAGTQLTLAVAAQLSSFSSARFPTSIPVLGVNTLRLERYIRIEYDEANRPIGTLALNQRLTGEGNSLQSDWLCDASDPIVFERDEDGSYRFERCVLASGNRIEGLELPAGTELMASMGNAYPDGFIDQDRWVLSVPSSHTITVDGLPLSSPVIRLDSQRRIYEVGHTALAHAVQFGGIDHAAGTVAAFHPRSLRGAHANGWRLTATDGATVIQSRTGELLASPASSSN